MAFKHIQGGIFVIYINPLFHNTSEILTGDIRSAEKSRQSLVEVYMSSSDVRWKVVSF